MRSHIPAFLEHLAARKSPRTVRSYGAVLAAFADFRVAAGHDLAAVPSASQVEAFLVRPCADGTPRSPGTQNQELSALRAFGKFAVPELGWPDNPAAAVPFMKEPERDPAVPSIFEVRQLFLAASKIAEPVARSRALAVLALLSQLGLRVHELVALDLHQVDLVTGTLVAVRGKGATEHDLPLNSQSAALLAAWIADRKEISREGEAALFVSSRGTRISIRTVQRLVESLRRATGTPKHFSCHSLRHGTATIALTMGIDISTVAELLRHSNLNTTRRYAHLVDVRRRDAVDRLGATVPPAVLPPPIREPASENFADAAQNAVDVLGDLGDTPPSELAPKAPDLTRSKGRGSLTSRSRAPAFHPSEGNPTDAARHQAFFAFGLALGLLVWPSRAAFGPPTVMPAGG